LVLIDNLRTHFDVARDNNQNQVSDYDYLIIAITGLLYGNGTEDSDTTGRSAFIPSFDLIDFWFSQPHNN